MLAQGSDGSGFGTWFDEHGVTIVATLVVASLVTVALQVAVRRFRRKLAGSPSVTQELNLQRIATLTGALSTAGIVVIWTIAILLVLGNLGTDLGPFFASAGIAGVALGFGAQSIVRDTLSGFFILLENQFGMGDVLELQTTAGAVTGKVESLTLRVTTLRAFDGTLHLVPNGNIQIVSNKSRGWARAIVDVRIAYGEDVDRVRGILEQLFEDIAGRPHAARLDPRGAERARCGDDGRLCVGDPGRRRHPAVQALRHRTAAPRADREPPERRGHPNADAADAHPRARGPRRLGALPVGWHP